MKKPIGISASFLATALSIAMNKLGVTELTFTKEEFEELNLSSKGIKLVGEFDNPNDEEPSVVCFSSVPRSEMVDTHELH